MLTEKIAEFLHGKQILILGFGREGQSSLRFLQENVPDAVITIADRNQVVIDDANIMLKCGEHYLDDLGNYDVILKTPGISLRDIDTDNFEGKIYSQLELFLENFDGMTVGVTGTKGKSTTSALIYEMIKNQGRETVLLGNIGVPIFDELRQIRHETIVVLEMSSHQLQYVRRSPKIAVLTNIFPEHLDFYRSFDDYKNAKDNIWRFQQPGDVLIRGDAISSQKVETTLPGEFNQINIACALAVIDALGLDLEQAKSVVRNFRGLKHRLELVGEFAGVKYYDNAIATIPEATIAAIEALSDVDTVIIGGMDRGVGQEKLVEFLQSSAVRNVICLPETGWRVADELGPRAIKVNTLSEAVQLAKKLTASGKSCLLSPAAASYNAYKNFEEKGDEFQRLVRGE